MKRAHRVEHLQAFSQSPKNRCVKIFARTPDADQGAFSGICMGGMASVETKSVISSLGGEKAYSSRENTQQLSIIHTNVFLSDKKFRD